MRSRWLGVDGGDERLCAKYQSFLILSAYFGGVFQFRLPDVGQCLSFLPDYGHAHLAGPQVLLCEVYLLHEVIADNLVQTHPFQRGLLQLKD